MASNPYAHSIHILLDLRVNGGAPRGQIASLFFELGENLFIGRHDPVECTTQVDPGFFHNDGENIMVISPRLLNVVRVHVLIIYVRWDIFVDMDLTNVRKYDGFCDQTEE